METGSSGCDPKIRKLHKPLFCGEDVGALDVPMYDTLVVEVQQPVQDLRHVKTHKVLGELAKVLADGMKGAILTVPAALLMKGKSKASA